MSDTGRAPDREWYDSVYGGFAEANARHQSFLGVVEPLASERRLSRLAYVARKPPAGVEP